MITSYIGIGSNLENPLQQVRSAIKHIQAEANIHWVAQSSWYRSTPVGPADQPDYINGAVCIDTDLTAEQLLQRLHAIEHAHGRVRDVRWGARTLDLDILLYGDQTINNETLIIPHKELANRNFVLQPLLDISANLALPNGVTVAELLTKVGSQGLTRLEMH